MWTPTISGWKRWTASSRHSDFFTIDVADTIGKPAARGGREGVCGPPSRTHRHDLPFRTLTSRLTSRAPKSSASPTSFCSPCRTRGKFTGTSPRPRARRISSPKFRWTKPTARRRRRNCSIILAAMADEKIPLQTIAPKFTGRFNKGVDYVGDVKQFEKEFNEDLAVIAFAIQKYGLPPSLKLSVHSGSDKFSIYEPMRRALKKFDAGVHIKTAGTTWLEELIGLAEAGGDGLEIAKEIYAYAIEHVDEFCAPYATVIDIDQAKLPARGGGERLEFAAIRRRAAARPEEPGLQSQFPPVAARQLQSRRQEGRPLSQRAEKTRGRHRQKRDGKSFRAAHETVAAGPGKDPTGDSFAAARNGSGLKLNADTPQRHLSVIIFSRVFPPPVFPPATPSFLPESPGRLCPNRRCDVARW